MSETPPGDQKFKPFTHAVYARDVGFIMRRVAAEASSMAEGMWNPQFCSADATAYAVDFLQDIRARLDWLEARMSAEQDPTMTGESHV
jgi:hypothetical protein